MKTFNPPEAKKPKLPRIDHYTATLNGEPCACAKIAGLTPRGGVLLPFPAPHPFKKSASAQRAIDRSERIARKVRESLVRDFLVEKDARLALLAGPLTWAVIPVRAERERERERESSSPSPRELKP